MTATFFGPDAERIRDALPADLNVLVYDVAGAPAAFLNAVARRQVGERFVALPLVDDLRVLTHTGVAGAIAATADSRARAAFGAQLDDGTLAVNGRTVGELYATDERPWQSIYEVASLADALLIRSTFEYAAFYAKRFAGRPARRIELAPSIPAFVPDAQPANRAIIWTGRRPAGAAVLAALGLESMAIEAAYVADAPVPNLRARFIDRADPALGTELALAACIVCTDASDPSDAVAFARAGAAVVAPLTSGAIESAGSVVTWDAGHIGTLARAVATAIRERSRPQARRDLPIVRFNEPGVDAALGEAAQLRERDRPYAALPFFEDLRVSSANYVGPSVNASTDRDQRYVNALALAHGQLHVNGAPSRELYEIDRRPWEKIAAIITGADELLVRSFYEYSTLLAERVPGRRIRRLEPSPAVPAFSPVRSTAPSVVVWHGRRPASDAMLALIGLEEFRGAVTYISDAPIPNISARFVARTDTAVPDVLAHAGCIVCVDPADPSDAVGFSRAGARVVAPITAGAIEFDPDITTWDAADARNIFAATARSLARSLPADIAAAQTERPLVSILTATWNRRTYLRQMLQCIGAQTYPNVESIVINDGGENVDDIVAEFPFARVINLETNRGTLGALQAGIENARGAYIGLLPDDDWLYPDHVELLMSAIGASGAAVAHTNSLIRFTARDGDRERTVGFNSLAFAATTNPTAALVGTSVAGHQCLQRRDTFAESDVGWYIADSIVADQEYHMRLFEKHQLVWVDRFTCEFRDHAGNSGKLHDWAQATAQMYERDQPVVDRPIITAMREKAVAEKRNVAPGFNVNPPTFVLK